MIHENNRSQHSKMTYGFLLGQAALGEHKALMTVVGSLIEELGLTDKRVASHDYITARLDAVYQELQPSEPADDNS